jgi:hypothetical protein
MKLVHDHCDVVVDTGPWVQDLMDIMEGEHTVHNFLIARGELLARQERWTRWLTQHGYQAGRHYWTCKQGYRFSSGGIATAFVLGVLK